MPRPMSGRYVAVLDTVDLPGLTDPKDAILRLDVDGSDPLQLASFEIRSGTVPINLLFKLNAIDRTSWRGKAMDSRMGSGPVPPILDPSSMPPIRISWNADTGRPRVDVVLESPIPGFVFPTFEFESRFFRRWHLTCHGYQPDPTSLIPHRDSYTLDAAHDPAYASIGLRDGTVDLKTVFERAGIHTEYPDGLQELGSDAAPAEVEGGWSNSQLHDLMEEVWSRYVDASQWACWLFLTTEYDDPETAEMGAAGMMFDEIGEAPRQAAAVFTQRIKNASHSKASGAAKDVWRDRYVFFVAVHELGHCLNLAHSWDKVSPWLEMGSDSEERSFMNYPLEVEASTTYSTDELPDATFFKGYPGMHPAFGWKFSKGELTYLRHAPEQYVIPGGYSFLKEHGMYLFDSSSAPGVTLTLDDPVREFELFEPAHLDVLLEVTGSPISVDPLLLTGSGALMIRVTDTAGNARLCRPWRSLCASPDQVVTIDSDRPLRASAPIAAGGDGWCITEPGEYTVQAAVDLGEAGVVVSNEVLVRVLPWDHPVDATVRDEWASKRMARFMLIRGSNSRRFESCRLAARAIVDESPSSKLAVHAEYALLRPHLRHSYRLGPAASAPSLEAVVIDQPGDQPTFMPQMLDFVDRSETFDVLGETRFAIALRELRQALRAQRPRVTPDSANDWDLKINGLFQGRVRPQLVDEFRWGSDDTD